MLQLWASCLLKVSNYGMCAAQELRRAPVIESDCFESICSTSAALAHLSATRNLLDRATIDNYFLREGKQLANDFALNLFASDLLKFRAGWTNLAK